MTLEGTIQNGVVVLVGGAELPEGTPVMVVVDQAAQPVRGNRMSEEERLRVLAIARRIASLPDEQPGDTFSGASHDKAIYGEP